MRIHTVKEGDTVFSIARKYAIPPAKIIENNALSAADRLIRGQKLLLFTPTRTYTVRGGDTLSKIATRFNTSTDELLAYNPSLMGSEKIYPEQILAIKYDTPRYGNAAANGYYYEGCTKERLLLALPYLTYISISGASWQKGTLKKLFKYGEGLSLAKENGITPIIRIYTEDTMKELSASKERFFESIISLAEKDGFFGICLAAYTAMKEKSEFSEFLLELKKKLMLKDLFLHLELDGNGKTGAFPELSEIADSLILNYQRTSENIHQSFEEAEAALLKNYANEALSEKTLIELPSFAYSKDSEIELKTAEEIARKAGADTEYDEKSKLCYFFYNSYRGGKRERVRIFYEAPENTKAKLELAAELGYMGVSFDIMRVPVEYLMLYCTSFSRQIPRGRVAGRCSDSQAEI